jgi:hypothetical protein
VFSTQSWDLHFTSPATSGRSEDDLDIAILTLIKLRKGLRRLVKAEAVADDSTRFGCPGDDHVPQLGVPPFVIVPAHCDRDVFIEKLGPRDPKSAFSQRGHLGIGVSDGPHANNGYAAGGIDQIGNCLGDP